MTVVDVRGFRPDLSAAENYRLVNELAISYIDFAINSFLFQRAYGVKTGSLEGANYQEFYVNNCIKEEVYRALWSIQEDTEDTVGFNLSDRYHYEDIAWPSYGRTALKWPGLDTLNVQPVWSEVENYGPFDISPYVELDITVDVGGATIAHVDASFVDNPRDVILRKRSTGGAYSIEWTKTGYPQYVSGEWLLPINTTITPYNPADEVDVQHRKYVFIDVDPPASTECEDGIMHPVYYGTTQKIALAKPVETVGGKLRYWFYVYTLVNPAFISELVDLEVGEFYKLYRQVEIKCLTETEVTPQLVRICGEENIESYDLAVKIIDASHSIIQINVDDDDFTEDCWWAKAIDDGRYCTEEQTAWRVRIYYKTTTSALPERLGRAISNLRRATIAKVAAELPTEGCGCELKSGFIFDKKQAYAEARTNALTGETIYNLQYGDLLGQIEYAQILGQTPIYRPRIVIPVNI